MLGIRSDEYINFFIILELRNIHRVKSCTGHSRSCLYPRGTHYILVIDPVCGLCWNEICSFHKLQLLPEASFSQLTKCLEKFLRASPSECLAKLSSMYMQLFCSVSLCEKFACLISCGLKVIMNETILLYHDLQNAARHDMSLKHHFASGCLYTLAYPSLSFRMFNLKVI